MRPGDRVRSKDTGWLAQVVSATSKGRPPTTLVHWCEGPLAGREARVDRRTLRKEPQK